MSETGTSIANGLKETEEYKKTKQKIERIQLALYSMPAIKGFLPYREIFHRNFAKCYEKWLESERISGILRDLKTQDELKRFSPESQSMIKMLAYLGLIESVGVALMDLVLFLIIINDKEIHTRGAYVKHVETFEELEGIWDLDYKLRFIDSLGITIFRDKIINKDLRDKIAHLKFRIESDGTIKRKDNGYNTVNIDVEISKFWEGVDTVKLIFEELKVWQKLKQIYDEQKQKEEE